MAGKINKELLPGKLSFFFMVSATSWTYPFLILYLKDLGLTTTELAVIYGILPIIVGLLRPSGGATADKLQKHRQLALLCTLLAAICHSCFLLIPKMENKNNTMGNYSVVMKCENGMCSTWNSIEEGLANISSCSAKLKETFCERYQNESALEHEEYGYCGLRCNTGKSESESPRFGKTFWLVFGLYTPLSVSLSGTWMLLYAMNYAVLGSDRNKFGQQRVCGTIGGIITFIISAIAMNKYGSVVNEVTFTPIFIGFGVLMTFTGVTSMFFKLPHMSKNTTMLKDIVLLAKQPQIILLFYIIFIMGFLYGGAETFLMVYLRSMNASSWNMGACLLIQSLGEIPALYYSGRIIKKIGHIRCIYIILIAYSIRYLGTSFIQNPWLELPFSALKSIVFSIGFVTVSVYASLITPPVMHGTLQGLVLSTHYDFGRGIGVIMFGPSMDSIGARWSFRIGSVIAIATCVFYAIAQRFVPPIKFVTHDDVKGDVEYDDVEKEKLNDADKEKKENEQLA